MTYIVNFRDKTSTIIETKKGEILKDVLLQKTPPVNIEINGELYRSSEIVSVKQGGKTEADVPKAWAGDNRRIVGGKVCMAQYSIHKEILEIILKEYPDSWGEKCKDKVFQEQLRRKLRATGAKWCDYKEGECACDTISDNGKEQSYQEGRAG